MFLQWFLIICHFTLYQTVSTCTVLKAVLKSNEKRQLLHYWFLFFEI